MNRALLTLIFILVAGSAAAQEKMQPPVSGRPASVEGILPADVLSRVDLLRREVERVRLRLQLPAPVPLGLKVAKAQPREVYFQALTVLRKSNQLCFERARVRGAPLASVSAAELAPYHVWQVVNAALERVRVVSGELQATGSPPELASPDATTPTDVCNTILELSRSFDPLLLEGFAPADVFEQVTWAVHHAARLLSAFPRATRLPPAPTYEAGKVPADVHARLLECLELVRQLAKRLDVSVLDIRLEDVDRAAIAPSDVYNVASLVTAELAYLHSTLPLGPVVPAHPPSPKVPADVHQRAGMLQAQLVQLVAEGQQNPAALRPQPSAR